MDQRPKSALKGGERVELLNLTPGAVLTFALPTLGFTCQTYFGRRVTEHAAMLASVIIEPEEMRLTLIWQSSLRVRAPDVAYLDATRIREVGGPAS